VDGHFIPASTTILINGWGIHHDEANFVDPSSFSPSRYSSHDRLAAYYATSADYANRDHYVYGAGRRICPGVHLAERKLFLAVAKLLWAFDFKPAKDADGKEAEVGVDPVKDYVEGVLLSPKPFGIEITPRSEARRRTILKELDQAQGVFRLFEEPGGAGAEKA
jgi:cytochrome P450 family 619